MIEDVIPKPDGSTRVMLTSKRPLLDKNHNIIGIVGVSVDITPQKEIEAKLQIAKEEAERANRSKVEFLENIRHDLRTPLTGIIGYTKLIKDEAESPKIQDYAQYLYSSSQALLDLFNEILEAMEVSSERTILKINFSLKEKLQQIIYLNLPKANEKNLALIFNYDDRIPKDLIGDPKRMQRIVLNLLSNALNFTSEGKVEVSVVLSYLNESKRRVIVKIIVADTGIGIPEANQQEVFERFKRLKPAHEENYKGLGLGLAIVKQFVDDLNGEINVESEIGKGSIFTCLFELKIPLLEMSMVDRYNLPKWLMPDFSYYHYSTQPVLRKKNASNLTKLLLVEDNSLISSLGEIIFSKLNCMVDIAKNGRNAIIKAKEKRYDLIIMDLGLPDIGGNQVTKEIRDWEKENNKKKMSIVALTAHVDVESGQKSFDVGIQAIISKPLTEELAIEILNVFADNLIENEQSTV